MQTFKIEQQIFQLQKKLQTTTGKSFFALKNKIEKLKIKVKEQRKAEWLSR